MSRSKTPVKKSRILRNVLLGLFLLVGTVIIVLASMVLLNIFMADDINTRELTSDLEEFMAVYEEYPSMRDLPQGLQVVSSKCEIKDNIYTYTLTIANTGEVMKEYSLQVFYNDMVTELKPTTRNPFITEYSDDGLVILADETKEFTITGTISKDVTPEEFGSAMEYVYLEVIYGDMPGRVMVPVNVTMR